MKSRARTWRKRGRSWKDLMEGSENSGGVFREGDRDRRKDEVKESQTREGNARVRGGVVGVRGSYAGNLVVVWYRLSLSLSLLVSCLLFSLDLNGHCLVGLSCTYSLFYGFRVGN